ncbi:MAG: outer membrane protein assembly factor BamE [Acidithiobacillus ferriphilus]|jgi:outer membrane protein assembly factor BamE|uniref:Outer membrane protein assembly factor BamE n=3 Tax=Acidithiobacillus TaxID=119977 RepID=A0A179BH12_ACIFR|nr:MULTISPECIES: outer membrane protein assembly factor BamE [Acidithiobacillus]OYV78436.1 MAG: outer membrane protein assembly factor BamE [Acidithiobacillus ferrivorans]MBU2827982.1 outer membrane protein assembly factor BamE [Acidithiobacillus ferriphilus]MBU2830270.1 outer membrane protein assembly factor BamE [Acidithiobacillus ferriphilus]MBU2831674.1 outer membrane protein assembly factor BamE [Acidithiobacillus ferriphilus]MBU2847423.1 outer membrane protein assembly factor BamE [Acidi
MRSFRLITLLTFCALLLGACSIYRVNVQQGNIITAKELADLHPGMDMLQVRSILGSPLLQDPWHPHQWIYAYSLKPAYGATKVRKVRVFFGKDGKLISIHGDAQSTASPTAGTTS